MSTRIQIFAVAILLALIVLVIELIRRRKLMERYAILWLTACVVLLVLAISKTGLERLASVVGIAYPPSAVFAAAFAFVTVLLLHFSTAMSRLTDQIKILAQRQALLEERLREAEHPADAPPQPAPRI
jgi:hypothetical protein